ncbi:MAG: Gfo/Idh/MocA family oxidoreductase [Opitutaceae bacterium]
MKQVRLGIVGLGNMGSVHARSILDRRIDRATLVAVCDTDPDRLKPFPELRHFASADAMIASGEVDAVIVATPHYDHTTIGAASLRAGLHTLVEKPISVHKADAERLIAAYTDKKLVFAAMFNQRTDPHYTKVREMIRSGELGKVRRINWIITTWFRPENYYASGGWRATWAGEGGGVLLNQCPHNLDLYQWLFGMPDRVRGFCQFGRFHQIEVEDDVTAYFEYNDGTTGVFITSTGEAPGTNRLEIAAERGRVVIDERGISFTRNVIPASEFSRTSDTLFGKPDTWDITIPVKGNGGQHNEIIQNFVDAILDGKQLLAPAVEGIHSVELGNAILHSAFTGKTVELPLNGRAYEQRLKKLIAESKPRRKKKVKKSVAADMSKSFTS